MEFLSQCKFVKQALEVPGKPLRNFSLILNLYDLDGAQFDVAPAGRSNGLAYTEGMRQLAIGLNVLAQVVKKHGNVYVAVVTEGGRNADAADARTGHAFLLGPAGAGNLTDYLYGNASAIAGTSGFVTDPNADAQAQPLAQGDLVGQGGTPTNDSPTMGAFQMGLVKLLETKKGMGSTTAELGNYVKLRTA
jgi:hypothetical protein